MNDNLFGRESYIEIINRTTKDKITINDDLRFTFDYYKSVDESESTSVGEIKIYGLTEQTYQSLGERHEAVVELYCGYKNNPINPVNKLFSADLSFKSWEVSESTTITTLTVNGNFNILYIGDKLSKGFPKGITFMEILFDIANDISGGKLRASVLKQPELQQSEYDKVVNLIQVFKLPYGTSVTGTPKQALDRFSKMFYFSYSISEDGVLEISFDALKASQTYLKNVDKSAIAELNVRQSIGEAQNIKKHPDGSEILKHDIGVNTDQALVISTETGMIGSPTLTYKTANKDYDEALRGDEEVKKKNVQKLKYKKDGTPIIDEKTNKQKLTKKPKTYSVTRKQVNCTVLLNAAIQPQSMVKLITKDNVFNRGFDGVYRVRDVKFKGDTHGNDWYMELELNE